MASTTHVKGLSGLRAALRRDFAKLGSRAKAAARRTAELGKAAVIVKAPEAFGDLRGSIHDERTSAGAKIVADAPHAAALEVGSRPHTPPLAPLVAWVKLKGMQGLGATTTPQTRMVAQQIAAAGDGSSTPIGTPEDIARQIQRAIAKHGTRPHWFMRDSIPELRALLHGYVQQYIKRSE